MTENKALKRDVRRRMAKTGERYTGPAKSTVALQIERLPDAAGVERARAYWKERLARLAVRLAER